MSGLEPAEQKSVAGMLCNIVSFFEPPLPVAGGSTERVRLTPIKREVGTAPSEGSAPQVSNRRDLILLELAVRHLVRPDPNRAIREGHSI